MSTADTIEAIADVIAADPEKTIAEAKASVELPRNAAGLVDIIFRFGRTENHLTGNAAMTALRRWKRTLRTNP